MDLSSGVLISNIAIRTTKNAQGRCGNISIFQRAMGDDDRDPPINSRGALAPSV